MSRNRPLTPAAPAPLGAAAVAPGAVAPAAPGAVALALGAVPEPELPPRGGVKIQSRDEFKQILDKINESKDRERKL